MAFSPFSPIRTKNAARALSDSSRASRVTTVVSIPAALILAARYDLYSCGRAPLGGDHGPLRALFDQAIALDRGGIRLLSAARRALSPPFALDGDGFTEKS